MHYYQFHIGDYATHTRHLNPIEDIAYRRLLDIYYLHERPLSDCLTTVARQINMREYEAEVGLVLTEFFDHIDGGYINRRADKEIEHYKAKVEQASRAGRASAERRTNGRSTDVQPTSNQEPITIVKAKQSRGTRLPADWILTQENIEFWNKTRPDLNPIQTACRFRDYWTAQPSSKGVKLDWDATWRNWVRAERSKDSILNQPQALKGWK
jgi:uncharacterized protein YdaU (DUF1376 family)